MNIVDIKRKALKIENEMYSIKNKAKKDIDGFSILTPMEGKRYFDLKFELQKLEVEYMREKLFKEAS